MKQLIGKALIALGKTPGFKSIVIGLLVKYPGLMDYVDAATEIYKDIKDLTKDDAKSSERAE